MTISREQLEKAAKAAGIELSEEIDGSLSVEYRPGFLTEWCPHINCLIGRGQLHDLAMVCKICIDPIINVIAWSAPGGIQEVEVNCQDFPALAEAVMLACCEQFDAKATADAIAKWAALRTAPKAQTTDDRKDAEIAKLVRMKLTSGNGIPVERCTIRASEIAAIDAAMAAQKGEKE